MSYGREDFSNIQALGNIKERKKRILMLEKAKFKAERQLSAIKYLLIKEKLKLDQELAAKTERVATVVEPPQDFSPR
jgi:hypothetical protein